jgi:intein/homing endonuclease
MDPKTYDKMKRIRRSSALKMKPLRLLRDKISYKGKESAFALRNYQTQMVFHTLLSKRFILGDDCGLGKCCVYNTLINCSEGLVPLGEMHDWSSMRPDTFQKVTTKWEVLIDGEKLPVKNFYYGGKKPTIKMKSRYMFEVEGSLVHPLLVWRDCTHQWVELQNMQEGDYICVERREMAFPKVEPTLNTKLATRGNCAVYPLPSVVTPTFARLAGYYVGEGSQCPQVNADILDLHEHFFGVALRETYEEGAQVTLNSAYLRLFFAKNGFDPVTSPSRVVPDCILRSTRASNVEFLRAYFEGAGSVLKSGGVELSTTSEDFGRHIQVMLARFGIVANRSPKKIKGSENKTYRLTIFGSDARVFRDKIGFISTQKISDLETALDRPTNANHDVIPNSAPLIENLRAKLKTALSVQGANSDRKGGGLKKYGSSFVNTLNGIRNLGRNPTYDFIDKFLAICDEQGLAPTSEYKALKILAETRYFYDPVDTLERGYEEVFDIEVDDPRHCFVGNGIVNHNTLEAITTIAALWEKDTDLKIIIVTNTSVMKQWGGEIDKFTEGIGWRICEGGPDKRADLYEDYFENWDDDKPQVLITNYHRLKRDKRVFRDYAEGHKYCLILDEVTAVKNPDSQTHHVFRELSLGADRVYGLTATLIKNNLTEGFGIYRVVVPDLFRTHKGFLRNYCVTRLQRIPGKRHKAEIVVGHRQDHIIAFREVIDPYYLGRAKHDVTDELPVLSTKDISIPMERSQGIYYQEAVEGLLNINDGTEDHEEIEVTKLTSLIYCQEIANSPYLIGNDVKSGKEEYFLDMIKEEFPDQKVIVFTRFRAMVDRLQSCLETQQGYQLGIEPGEGKNWKPCEADKVSKGLVRVTGEESAEQRRAGAEAFQNTPNTNIIFITSAGIEAINLQEAQVMVFYDLPWSAGDYIQAVGRMIRIGSPHANVYAIHLLAETPDGEPGIDHHVVKTLEKKMGYIEQTLGERLIKGSAEEINVAARSKDKNTMVKVGNSNVSDLFDMLVSSAKGKKNGK